MQINVHQCAWQKKLKYFSDRHNAMLGWGEIVLILIAAIIFMGPEKLTDFARQLGKLYGEYKKAKRMIELEIIYGIKPLDDEEIEKKAKENYEKLLNEVKDLSQEVPPRSDQ